MGLSSESVNADADLAGHSRRPRAGCLSYNVRHWAQALLAGALKLCMVQGEGGRCFSRAEPRHKQDIVRLLKEMGEVSALRKHSVVRPAADTPEALAPNCGS